MPVRIMPLYEAIARATTWPAFEDESLEQLLPSGSGFDAGSKVIWHFKKTNTKRITIESAYHFLNDGGYYVGWAHFEIIVLADMITGFTLSLRSKGAWPQKYIQTKEYILDVFNDALERDVEVEYNPEERIFTIT